MPITDHDFIVKLHTSYGLPCVNTFFFRSAGTHQVGRAGQLASIFNSNVVTPFAGIANTVLQIGEIVVENLVDLSDYFTQESTVVQGGIESTSPAPPFVAYKFRMNRSTRAGRHGYKRFAGVSEELVNFGTATISGALATAMPAFLTALGATLSTGGNDFTPMIPKRLETLMPDGKYRWILTDLLPVGMVLFQGLTTQNTRKT